MFGPLMAPGASLRRLLLAFMGLVAVSRHPVHIYFAGAGPHGKNQAFLKEKPSPSQSLGARRELHTAPWTGTGLPIKTTAAGRALSSFGRLMKLSAENESGRK
jgi:hypothetical protein